MTAPTVGNNVISTSGTSYVTSQTTTGLGVNAGDTILAIVMIGYDFGSTPITVTSVTDSDGNTYTFQMRESNTSAVQVEVWTAIASKTNASLSVTANIGAAQDMMLQLVQVVPAAGFSLNVGATGPGATG